MQSVTLKKNIWFLGSWVWKPFKAPSQEFKYSSLQYKSCNLQEECSSVPELNSQKNETPKSGAAFNNLGFIFLVLISSFYTLELVPLQKNLTKIQFHESCFMECWNPWMTFTAEGKINVYSILLTIREQTTARPSPTPYAPNSDRELILNRTHSC